MSLLSNESFKNSYILKIAPIKNQPFWNCSEDMINISNSFLKIWSIYLIALKISSIFITLLWKYDPPFQYCSDATIYLSDTALKMNILQHMVIYWILDECLQNQLWKKMKYPDTIELTHLHYNHEEYFTTKYDTICPKPRRVKRRLYLIYTIVNK